MNFQTPHLLSFAPPILEIPAHQIGHRVQRATPRRGSVRFKGFVLAPTGGLTGRFDLADEPTAYLADSPETALYESVFRREVRGCHWDRLLERAMVTFETRASVHLADLRGLEERYPALQSLRYESQPEVCARLSAAGSAWNSVCIGPAPAPQLRVPVQVGH